MDASRTVISFMIVSDLFYSATSSFSNKASMTVTEFVSMSSSSFTLSVAALRRVSVDNLGRHVSLMI